MNKREDGLNLLNLFKLRYVHSPVASGLTVPHYVYLLLKMPGKAGVLTFHGDLKKLYDCDQEVIESAVTSRMPRGHAKAQ
jgi:hypothetical protein